MEYLLVFAAGVVSALVAARLIPRVSGDSSAPLGERLQRLQELAGPLTSVGDASAHPRDLETNPVFKEAVAILASEDVPTSAVVDYASGAHFVLAAAAYSALCDRADRDATVAALTRQFPHVRPWPAFYALRFFARCADRPPMGQLVLQVHEYSSEHPLIPTMFAEHFTERAALGDSPAFGDTLKEATVESRSAAEALLGKIDHPVAQSLLAELTAWRRNAIDRTYLQTIGRFVEEDSHRLLVLEHDGIREQLAQADRCLSQEPYRSVLVVGEPRSGRSSFLVALGARAAARGWTIFEAGAVNIMAGQQYIGQLEERMQRLVSELASDKRVLWIVPDFTLFASSGRHKFQEASMLDQVLPAIAAGRLVLASEITPAGLSLLLQSRPALGGLLELVRLPTLTDDEANRVTRAVAGRLATIAGIEIGPDVVESAIHLARHYFGTSQMPAAAIDLLKRTVQRVTTSGGTRMDRRDLLDVLSHLSGMPALVIDDRERLDLSTLRQFFTSRVIGQDEAVDAVVDRIAMVKAGLIDPAKPVGVFLFAGPTGTGKTELAKTLAEFLFGATERLIRLDMSEFQTAESTKKIVGDADPHADVDSLAHRVRKQPFSVLLLDEFEKAHPNTWDLFLQVFDDGRLTDAAGRTSDFRHCLIILTSNLGAKIPHGPGVGFGSTAAAFSQEQVVKTVHQTFRPEFVNRLDAVIVFRPLSRELMRGILMKELARVLERRGLRDREWAVEWESSALDFLLDRGFSPTLGARPVKRAIDRYVLAPLAATLVEHRFPEGDQFLFVRSDGRGIQVEFVDPDAPAPAPPAHAPEPVLDPRLTLPRMMLQPSGTRDEQSALAASLRAIESTLAGDRWLAVESALTDGMQQPGFWDRPDRFGVLSRYALLDRVKAAIDTARGLEARLQRSATHGKSSRDLVTRLASQLHVIEMGIEDVWTDAPVEVVLSVSAVLETSADPSAAASWCGRLFETYRRWASRRHMHFEHAGDSSGPSMVVISGFGSARLLSGERGLHILEYTAADDEAARAVARVHVAPSPLDLPEMAEPRRAALAAALAAVPAESSIVRRYRLDGAPLVRDVARGWRTGRVDLVMDGHFDLLGALLPRD